MEKIQEINLYEIRPSTMNPRKTFDHEALQELADNIKSQGLLQPITIRPVDELLNVDGTVSSYEVVCGERRYRAVKLNGSKTITCIVRELTDEQAFDAMITENLQRKDVDPTEEAFAFGELAKRGQTTEEIALRFGKSTRFVLERIKLNSLIPELALKLKDGVMSIGAALVIYKLDEDMQKEFYSRYKNDPSISKFSAERYCNNIFGYISSSEWVKGHRPKFEGGCGRQCSGCEFNTKNAGCLFYEMKSDDKTAKCTNREKFKEKTRHYFMSIIDAKAKQIVKAGGTLEFGKIAIVKSTSNYTKDPSDVDALCAMCRERGYEVFNREDVFDSYSWYNEDDERLKEKLANHEVYQCFVISTYYNGVNLDMRYYNFKKDLSCATNETIKEGAEAQRLAEKLKKAESKCREHRSDAYSKLFEFDVDNLSNKPLTENELNVLAAYMLKNSYYALRTKLIGHSMLPPASVALDYVKEHPEQRNTIIRDYLRQFLNSNDGSTDTQRDIASEWFNEKVINIEQDYTNELSKKTSKIAQQLDEMGYTRDGKKKPEKKPRKPKQSTLTEQYNQMKEKHPDAVLLFRVGDFYESYFHDAVTVSETLGITLTKRSDDATEMAGFPHHALDTYLPKLTRAGLRVAICDQLDMPEKTTKRGKK